MITLDEYRDMHVVVTGCASGIGQATARALVELGAHVHGLDINEPELLLGSFTQVDLSAPASIEVAASSISGKVDALFNCAGTVPMAPPLQVLKVNFLGLRLMTEKVLPHMGPGSAVVSVSSDGGFHWRRSLPGLAEFLAIDSFAEGLAWYEQHQDSAGHAYAFGKEALNVWTMQQSASLIKRGIRINVTSPGSVQTPMLEAIEKVFGDMVGAPSEVIGRRSAPEEQVGPLLMLNSSLASYINGADIPVDGGYWASLALTGDLS